MPLRNLYRTVRMMGLVNKLHGSVTSVIDDEHVKVTWTHIVKDNELIPLSEHLTYRYCLQELEFIEWSLGSQALEKA